MPVLLIPTALYIPVIYFFFPETMNRSLEDINAQFGEDVAVHYFGATEEEEREYAKAIEEEEGMQQPGVVGREDKAGVQMVEMATKV